MAAGASKKPRRLAALLDDALIHQVLDSMPIIVWTCRPDGATDFFNRRGVEYTGIPAQDLTGDGWLGVVHPEDRQAAETAWREASQGGAVHENQYRVRRADGEYRWMATRGLPILDEDEAVIRWIGTWTDVHEQRLAARQAAESLALTEAVTVAAPISLFFTDLEFRLLRWNETMAWMHGLTEEHRGRPVAEISPSGWEELEAVYRKVAETGEPVLNVEVSRRRPDGEMSHWINSYYPVRTAGEIVGVGVVGRDISNRVRLEELSRTVLENMTEGLYSLDADGRITMLNRAAERLLGWTEAEVRGQRAHALWHHQRSDGSPLPESECDLLRVRLTGEPLRSEGAFTNRDGTIVPVSYSAGPLQGDGSDHGVVVVFRDISAEHTARSRVRRELDSLTWVGRIQDALDEDRFTLFSQPIVTVATREQVSEELLIRMRNRQGEIVLPGSFLPVAEKYGMVADIDRWVVTRAAHLAASGRRVEVNLSAWSIVNVDLLPHIDRALRDAGADPADMVFEITETALMQDIDRGERFARGVTEMGCKVALDDFGTGFAGFTHLKRIPISFLKIDMEFVRDLASTPANRNVVEAIVSLARAFGHQTIAEGVEDEDTMALLGKLGVDLAQGYLLGRPRPAQEDHTLPLW